MGRRRACVGSRAAHSGHRRSAAAHHQPRPPSLQALLRSCPCAPPLLHAPIQSCVCTRVRHRARIITTCCPCCAAGHAGGPPVKSPVDINNLLLRGSVLRTTPWAIGMAVNVGRDSKIVQNMTKAPRKVCVCVCVCLCVQTCAGRLADLDGQSLTACLLAQHGPSISSRAALQTLPCLSLAPPCGAAHMLSHTYPPPHPLTHTHTHTPPRLHTHPLRSPAWSRR